MKKPRPPARDPALQAVMTLKALLNRKIRVRDRRIAEMEASIAELRDKVAEAEKTYARVKRGSKSKR